MDIICLSMSMHIIIYITRSICMDNITMRCLIIFKNISNTSFNTMSKFMLKNTY